MFQQLSRMGLKASLRPRTSGLSAPRPILALRILLTLFLFFSSPLVLRMEQSFTILGTVRGSAGEVVRDIRISLLTDYYSQISTVFADSSGRFQFRGLKPGAYLIMVETAGTPYEEQTQRIDLQSITRRLSTNDEPFSVEMVLRSRKGVEAKPDLSVSFFQQVPDAAREEYERGVKQLKKEKSDPGMAALKKAIGIFPDYFLALETLGTEYVKRGEFTPAVPVLNHAVEINRNAPKSLYALGVTYLNLKQNKEAIEWLEKAGEIDSKNCNVHMMLGLAYGNNHTMDRAESSFKQAYELGGARVAEAHLYLASIYSNQEKYNDAVRELELYLKEVKEIKDPSQINGLIAKLRAKEKAKR